jgi:hypothetical protein
MRMELSEPSMVVATKRAKPLRETFEPQKTYKMISDLWFVISDWRLKDWTNRIPITDYRLPITDYWLPVTVFFSVLAPSRWK